MGIELNLKPFGMSDLDHYSDADLLYALLTRQVKYKDKELAEVNLAAKKTQRFGTHYSFLVEIDKDHCIDVTIDHDSLSALKNGVYNDCEVDI